MNTLGDKVFLIQSADSQDEAFGTFNALMLDYGYDSNVYTLLTDHPSIGEKSTHGLAASYPQDWLDFYNARQYQGIDPVWQRLLQSPTPFFWGDVLDRLRGGSGLTDEQVRESLRMMDEAAEAGVADGIGISYVSPLGEMAAVGLSRTKGEKERRYEDMAEVFLLATFFHEKYMSFYERPQIPPLTLREREVLLWAAENKSDSDIGQILGVSPATVRFHWKNIFAKLGVNGRLLAVIKAIQLQMIMPQLIKAPYQTR
ncbi:helix-turn-helix transcriptional regulator [Pannonibacter phragmitetus]|uniref:helix-turn-helix transcriptional regulator n=1 Tax=Pannonibacter phragmitetus TaxID=121719 RepID=UPI000F4475E9|nr:LuxR family transcriptional regulator [Pannonibacter phragmitetus]